MSEVYLCLYCNERLVGDEAWLAHLQSQKHGAAEKSRGFSCEIAELNWSGTAQEPEEHRLNVFESRE